MATLSRGRDVAFATPSVERVGPRSGRPDPEPGQRQLDGVEWLGPHDVVPAGGENEKPGLVLPPVDLERL